MRLSYYTKMLREDAQTAVTELIATQYRSRARVLQAKLFFVKETIGPTFARNIVKGVDMALL